MVVICIYVCGYTQNIIGIDHNSRDIFPKPASTAFNCTTNWEISKKLVRQIRSLLYLASCCIRFKQPLCIQYKDNNWANNFLPDNYKIKNKKSNKTQAKKKKPTKCKGSYVRLLCLNDTYTFFCFFSNICRPNYCTTFFYIYKSISIRVINHHSRTKTKNSF